jgi:hypothetical protein
MSEVPVHPLHVRGTVPPATWTSMECCACQRRKGLVTLSKQIVDTYGRNLRYGDKACPTHLEIFRLGQGGALCRSRSHLAPVEEFQGIDHFTRKWRAYSLCRRHREKQGEHDSGIYRYSRIADTVHHASDLQPQRWSGPDLPDRPSQTKSAQGDAYSRGIQVGSVLLRICPARIWRFCTLSVVVPARVSLYTRMLFGSVSFSSSN